MKKDDSFQSIGQTAQAAGVSVRTLHYYDEIGLLKPASVSENGYRQYSAEDQRRLSEIVELRQAGVPLRDIKALFAVPDYSREQALRTQLAALEAQKTHLEEMIMETKKQLAVVSDSAAVPLAHEAEAADRWGDTEAWAEYERRQAQRTDSADHAARFAAFAGDLFSRLADLEGASPEDPSVQVLVAEWQSAITENWYPCTKEILSGLATMYTEDPRFSGYICQYGSTNLAAFFADAIRAYCAS